MSVKERILAIRLFESVCRQPDYANRIGVLVEEKKKEVGINRSERNEEN